MKDKPLYHYHGCVRGDAAQSVADIIFNDLERFKRLKPVNALVFHDMKMGPTYKLGMRRGKCSYALIFKPVIRLRLETGLDASGRPWKG